MLPSAFISHGAPDRVLKDGPAHQFTRQFASLLAAPKAIVTISAHWQTPQLQISATGDLETIHDFWGFPAPLYEVQYPAVQPQWLTQQLSETLQNAGLTFQTASRGLDHGSWSILALAYPQANIPVASISLPMDADGQQLLSIGQALAPLREQDILIIGSGSATHNLRELQFSGSAPHWTTEFTEWLQQKVVQNDYEALAEIYASHRHAKRAHPTLEHYAPLLVAMGAAYQQPNQLIHDSYELGSINNSSWLFG